jgi:hypothetical protein
MQKEMKTIDILDRLVSEFDFSSTKAENSGADAFGAAVMAILFLTNRGNNSDQAWSMALSTHQEPTDKGLLAGITCIRLLDDDLISFRQGRNSLALCGRMECREFRPTQEIE